LYNPIFVTATNTDIGKTYTITTLIEELSKQGIRVGVYKPIETGVETLPIDGQKLFETVCRYNKEFCNLSIDDIVTYQYKLPAAPYVAKKDTTIDLEYIKSHMKYLQKFCDVLIVEGAGGLMVPINRDFFIIDLIKYLECHTLLVTSSKLGSINDTLLSISKLKEYSINFEWVINLYQDKDSFFEVTYPFYNDYFNSVDILQNSTKEIASKLLKPLI
jgi:dethiobiotin synthetase